jgi:hypothetical protein
MQRMPKYAKLMNRLRPSVKDSSSLQLLNSPFVLWLFSAAFLTIGASLISSRHECLATARSDIEEFRRLTYEIFQRRTRMLYAARFSSTPIAKFLITRSTTEEIQREVDAAHAMPGQTRVYLLLEGVELPYENIQAEDLAAYWREGGAAAVVFYHYAALDSLDDSLQLVPACSLWRLIYDAFMDDEVNAVEKLDPNVAEGREFLKRQREPHKEP